MMTTKTPGVNDMKKNSLYVELVPGFGAVPYKQEIKPGQGHLYKQVSYCWTHANGQKGASTIFILAQSREEAELRLLHLVNRWNGIQSNYKYFC